MNGLTAADYADTGQWRMIINIRIDGMEVWLENTIHQGIEPQELFNVRWDPNTEDLLSEIENAVYDHPRVLEDFSTRIVLFDRKNLFFPTELYEEEGLEEDRYAEIFGLSAEEVMTDRDKDISAAFRMAGGLKSFLLRTFPGARITSNLMQEVREKRNADNGLRVYLTVRRGEADFIFFENNKLISGSTHPWRQEPDIIYMLFNIIDLYGKNASLVKVIVSGMDLSPDTYEKIRSLTIAG